MKKNRGTILLNFAVLLAFIFIMGCGASKEGKEAKPENKPAADNKLEYKFITGNEIKYKMVNETKNSIQMMGQEQNFTTKLFAITSLIPGEILPDGSYSTILFADSLKMESDNPQVPDVSGELAKINGKKFKSKLFKDGKIENVEQIDQYEIAEAMKTTLSEIDPKTRLKGILLQLPDKSLNVNDTWSENKIDSSTRMGGKIYTKTTIEFKVLGKENTNGTELYKIGQETKIELNGTGSQMGNEFTITGKGKATGAYNFSKTAGALLDYKIDQAMDMSIDISAMGMTMPMTIITNTTVTKIK